MRNITILSLLLLRKKYNNQYMSGEITVDEFDNYMRCLTDIIYLEQDKDVEEFR